MSYQELPTDEEVAACDDLWGVKEDFLAKVEVKYITEADWFRATTGYLMPVPHVRGTMRREVVEAPAEWSIA